MKHYIAKTLFGLEDVLLEELNKIGVSKAKKQNRAVTFYANKETVYKVHLYSSLTLRVLEPFHSFKANNEDELYNNIYAIDWPKYMSLDDTFKIDPVVFSSIFTHSQYVGLKTKDALVDNFRDKYGKRPNVDVKKPNHIFTVNVRNSEIELSKDVTGDSLHIRGYKLETGVAPMSEVLAAGMIALSKWDGEKPLVDGMCGSGTLTIEALFKATNKAPGLERKHYAFKYDPSFDEKIWNNLVQEAKENVQRMYPPIVGIEIEREVFQKAKNNMVRAGFLPIHHLKQSDFFNYKPKEKSGFLLLNPPYDERIKEDSIEQFYEKIGVYIREHYKGWEAWIITSNEKAKKQLNLKAKKQYALFNGKFKCTLNQYKL